MRSASFRDFLRGDERAAMTILIGGQGVYRHKPMTTMTSARKEYFQLAPVLAPLPERNGALLLQSAMTIACM